MTRFCQLLPAVGGVHSIIDLKDSVPLIIGRCPLTGITDGKCSRKQVEVCANFAKKEVNIKHIGHHPMKVATKMLYKNDTFLLGPMGWFELLEGQYRYHVHFGEKMSKSSDQFLESNEANNLECDKGDIEPPSKRIKIDSTVQKKIQSFLRQDATSTGQLLPFWKEKDNLLILQYGSAVYSNKIASFDVDNTLIETASGKKFATGPTDWKLIKGVLSKLKSLSSEGYSIVLFTNQLGISKGKPTKAEFKEKIEAVADKLRVPLLMVASMARDIFRKPCTGMWKHVLENENGTVKVDVQSCFYVGDAAGRMENWMPGKKKDFSCTDRKFAANVGISFYTPEEIFLNYSPCKKYSWGEFNPTLKESFKTSTFDLATSQEMIIFVGYPASGKSTFFKQHLKPKGYCHVNRDTLGSWQKCVSKCREFLQSGKHVVVDNTSPDKISRNRYIEVAKQFNVPVRCFWFMTSLEHAKHNNRFRELTERSDEKGKVNDMVFNVYKSKFVEPSLDEGFTDVINIEFMPSFTDEYRRTLYHQFLE